MVTIVLLVSREKFLPRVIECLENLDCNKQNTSLLCVVDGDDNLFTKTRNHLQHLLFENILCVKSGTEGSPYNLDIKDRRRRIALAHNKARTLLPNHTQYVFSVEDDTLIPRNSLKLLMDVAIRHSAFAQVSGVELGRWGRPYVGAWRANDIYDLKELTSLSNRANTETTEESIDACGLFCTLIRGDLYKNHEFTWTKGLGPDVSFGIENRILGFENFIHWGVPCTHLYTDEHGKEKELKGTDDSQFITLVKLSDTKWGAIVIDN